MKSKKILLLAILFLGVISTAHADGVFDTIINSVYKIASTWSSKMLPIAAGIFMLVSTIEFTYAIAFKKLLAGDHQKLFYTAISRILVMSILYQFFVKDMDFYIGVLKWAMNIAAELGGSIPVNGGIEQGGVFSVSGLFSLMWDKTWIILTALTGAAVGAGFMNGSLGNFLFGMVGAILLVMLICCVTVMWLIIRAWFVMFGGFFLAGFIGSNWTRNYWQNYLKSVIGVALSLLSLSLVMVIVQWQWAHTDLWLQELPTFNILDIKNAGEWIATASNNLIAMLGVLVLDAVLIIGGPGLGASLASGVISTSLGEAIGAAAGVLAGASIVGKGAQAASTAAKTASGAAAAGKKAAIESMRNSLKNGIGSGEGNANDSKFREMAKNQAKEAGANARSAHMKQGFDTAKKQFAGAGRSASGMSNHLSRGTGGSGGGGPASVNTNSPSHH